MFLSDVTCFGVVTFLSIFLPYCPRPALLHFALPPLPWSTSPRLGDMELVAKKRPKTTQPRQCTLDQKSRQDRPEWPPDPNRETEEKRSKKKRTPNQECGPRVLRAEILIIHLLSNMAGSAADGSTFFCLTA